MRKPIKHFKIISILFMFFVFLAALNFNEGHLSDPFYVDELVYVVDDASMIHDLEAKHHLTLVDYRASGLATFKISETTDVESLLSMGFAYNQTSQIQKPPWQSTKDPYIDNQYALKMMQTFDAWEITVGAAFVTVAIIDTGIDITHEEFTNRISEYSYNAYTKTVGITEVIDDHGHGTMVAGVIGAIKDNSKGIAGIAQNIQLLIIKANRPNEGVFSDSALIDGIYYAVDQGADVINLSLGGAYLNTQTQQAIIYARAQGVIVIAASGNDGTDDLMYPAAFEETLAIAALDAEKNRAEYSNYGAHIDLSAPGSDIITTARNNGYATVSGTSFAAPQVAGVVALMLSHFEQMVSDEIIARLLLSSEDLGVEGKDPYHGHGMVNTYQSLIKPFVRVTFETGDAQNLDSMWFPEGSSPDLPIPLLEDHVFEGWFFDASYQIPYIPSETILSDDALLYAKFNASFHNVYFVTSGSAVSNMVVANDDTFELPSTEKSGYKFIAWTIDEAHLTPYEIGPVTADLTLYAHFELIIYYEVIRMDGDLLIDQTLYEEASLIAFDPFEKEGHTFIGWYYDEHFTQPFSSINIIEDLILYAKYDINQYTIHFETFDGDPMDAIIVDYHELFTLPTPSKEDHTFIDWFIESTFVTPYTMAPVTDNFTLYAQFVPLAYQVNYYIDDVLHLQKMVIAHETFKPIIIERTGYEFMGWMTDQTRETFYEIEPITEDLNLYAYFEERQYTVRFYDFDKVTLLIELMVEAHGYIELPDGPEKPGSTHFTYQFITWDQAIEQVTSNLDIYPIYARTIKKDSVTLNPSIDTIFQNQNWIDTGITLDDDTIVIKVLEDIKTSIKGRYQVTYELYDQDILIHTLIRMVRVTSGNQYIEMILNPGIDTLYVGDIHHDQGVSYEGDHLLNVTSNVQTSQAGSYTIIYQIENNGYIYQKTRVVHVVEPMIPIVSINDVEYIEKRKDDDYAL